MCANDPAEMAVLSDNCVSPLKILLNNTIDTLSLLGKEANDDQSEVFIIAKATRQHINMKNRTHMHAHAHTPLAREFGREGSLPCR